MNPRTNPGMNRHGFSLIEMLIAMGILAIVLGLLGTYFVQQAELSRSTQARTEVQDKVRLVMQIITQDLQLAGANRYIEDSGEIATSPSIVLCPLDPEDITGEIDTCFKSQNATGGAAYRDEFLTLYINSLRENADACRKVAYRFTGGTTLERADAPCLSSVPAPATPSLTLSPPEEAYYAPLAENIVALDIELKCSNSNDLTAFPDYDGTDDCPEGTSYTRSAVITIVGRSNVEVSGADAETFTTATDQSLTCGPNYICAALTQEVLMPNMKEEN